jgi:hypothetical protein
MPCLRAASARLQHSHATLAPMTAWADAIAAGQDGARLDLAALGTAKAEPRFPALIDWVGQCGPDMGRPVWLSDMCEMLERAARGGVRGLVSCPVRHYKTTTLMCAIARWLRMDPTLRVIYMSYTITRAQEVGKDIRDLCKRMGVTIERGHDTIATWRTPEGGGVDVMSGQQSRLGADVDILLVDDPYESGEECDKPEVRDAVDATILHYTMRLSRGGSAVLVMSRFHPDDAIGRRLERRAEQWEYIHKRAVDVVDGVEVALAPEVRTLEEMARIRAAMLEVDPLERLWYAQWQNEPRTPNATLFKTPLRYGALPDWPGFRDGIGIDMAYSPKKAADWFAIVVVRVWASQMYVRSVDRFKADEGLGETMIRSAWEIYGKCQIYSYMSGPEIGIAHNLFTKGIQVNVLPARFNKLIRARKTIDRNNGSDKIPGRILVPDHAPWAANFVKRLTFWRGLDGDEDDEIDGLVSVHDGMFGAGVTSPAQTMGRPRM